MPAYDERRGLAPEPACRLDGAAESAEGERSLLVLLDVVNKCNLLCVMCGYPAEAGDPRVAIDLESFAALADELFPLSRQVNLSCSYEPFMHKRFLDYLDATGRHRPSKISIATNGLLLDDAKVAGLVRLGLTHIAVSVDGATAETFEAIRVGGRYRQLLDRLDVLQRVKRELGSETPRLQFNYVLLEHNLPEAVALIDAFHRYDPYKFVFIHQDYTAPPPERRAAVETALRAALERCVEAGVIFEEVPDLVISRDEVLDAYGCDRRPTPEPATGCRDPWRFLRIRPNGDVQMCPVIAEPAGNVTEDSIASIWNGRAYRALREAWNDGRPPEICTTCAYRDKGLTGMRREQDRLEELLRDHLAGEARRRREPEPTHRGLEAR